MPIALVPIALENGEADEKNSKDDKKSRWKTPQTLVLESAHRRLPLGTSAAIPQFVL
jgi:hypothetical protein